MLQAQRITDQMGWNGRVHFPEQLDRLASYIGCQDDGKVTQQLLHREGLRVQGHLACLDLGNVQDVIQQPQQRLGSAMGLVGIVGLFVIERRLGQQGQHTQNGVHGCADFVAHIGQELALCRGCGLGLLSHANLIRNVDAQHDDVPVCQPSLHHPQQSPMLCGVNPCGIAAPKCLQAGFQPFVFFAQCCGVDAASQSCAQDLGEIGAGYKNVCHPGVHAQVFFVAIHQALIGSINDEGFINGIDGTAQQRRIALGFFFDGVPRGDVAVGSCHGERAARRIPVGNTPFVGNPDPTAIFVFDTVLDVDASVVAGNVTAYLAHDRPQVLWMHQCGPGRKADRAELFQCVANDLGTTRVDDGGVVREVPLPSANASRSDDVVECSTLPLDFLRCRFTLGNVDPDRDVAVDLPIIANKWRNKCVHPIQGAVLGFVAYLAAPRQSTRDDFPHVGPERFAMQAGAHDAVALSNEFFAGKSADVAKRIIDAQNRAITAGHGDNGMQIHSTDECIVLTQRRFQPVLCGMPAGHVRCDFHESGERPILRK